MNLSRELRFVEVENVTQKREVAELADIIWHEHFGPMFEPDVLEYVIRMVQSYDAINDQISSGYAYVLLFVKGRPIGYFAFRRDESKDELFLSKLYVLSNYRGLGIGRKVLDRLVQTARNFNLSKLSLTVYFKNKQSIAIYEKMGFKTTGTIKRDIGNDVIIHDIVMVKDTI